MRALRLAWILGFTLAAGSAFAQEAFRCTGPDGKVTYQQSPCPGSSDGRKVDISPANPDVDLSQRERLLKQGDEAGKRLEARAAAEEADRRRREEQRAKDEKREREAQAAEEARDNPEYIYAWPPGYGPRPPYYYNPWPSPPRPPLPPRPAPR